MKEMNEDILEKAQREKCIENFKKYILKEASESNLKTLIFKNEENLISNGLKGEFSSIYLRPIIYKIFLGLFPPEKSIQQWISITFNHRTLYSQLKSKHIKIIKKENNKIYNNEKEEELEKIIKLDLSRTFPEIQAFNQNKIINILYNVLYIYSKEYSINYKQGMNEIVSILFISLYPFYFPSNKLISKIEIINAINSFYNNKKYYIKNNNENIANNKKSKNNDNKHFDILFNFFQDENSLESDLYFIFANLMEKGFNIFYKEDLLQKKCENIIKNKLNIIDFDLYKHCIDINLASEIFLEKWILCFFDRYTSLQNCVSLLDIIITQEYQNKKDYKFDLELIDNICLAMILKYKKELLLKNDEEFLIFCLCYPKNENFKELIKTADFIKLKIQNKDFDIKNIKDNLSKRSSLIIKPKKPKYWIKSHQKNIKDYNNSYIGKSRTNSQNFMESKTSNNNIDKINFKKNIGNSSVNNLKKSYIKKDILKITNEKKNDGILHNLGMSINQFDDIKSEDLIDIYYF